MKKYKHRMARKFGKCNNGQLEKNDKREDTHV